MSLQQSKTFFKKLKETCKYIDDNVSEIKKKMNETSADAEYLSAKCTTDIQDRIQKLKAESNELKFKLEPNFAHNTDFIQHFRELTAETEVAVANLENYLKQYEYTPLNATESSPPPEKSEVSPIKNESQEFIEDLSRTPTLIDYGIASHGHSASTTQFKERKSSLEDLAVPPMIELKSIVKNKENSGSTPTLEINLIPHTAEETPPMLDFVRSVAHFPSTPKLEI